MAGHEGEGAREVSSDGNDRQWEVSKVWGEIGEREERGDRGEGGQSEHGG